MGGICGITYHDPNRPVPDKLVERMSNSIRQRDNGGGYEQITLS